MSSAASTRSASARTSAAIWRRVRFDHADAFASSFVPSIDTTPFWAAVVYVVVQLSRGRFSEGRASDRPIDIARRRYAAGEVTKAEYEELRHDLNEPAA